jgi:hypothetical protein
MSLFNETNHLIPSLTTSDHLFCLRRHSLSLFHTLSCSWDSESWRKKRKKKEKTLIWGPLQTIASTLLFRSSPPPPPRLFNFNYWSFCCFEPLIKVNPSTISKTNSLRTERWNHFIFSLLKESSYYGKRARVNCIFQETLLSFVVPVVWMHLLYLLYRSQPSTGVKNLAVKVNGRE